MGPTDRFAAVVAGGGWPLDELSVLIAAHAHPGLDIEGCLAGLDELAAQVPRAEAAALMATLFGSGRLRGNRENYLDPANSLLPDVMRRGLGIPITLCVVAVEVGRRLGVELVPVGLPGHVLVVERRDAGAFWDPFDGGTPLDLHGVAALFARLHPAGARFDPSMAAPSPPAAVIERMLSNLQRIYLDRGDRGSLCWVLRLRTLLPGADPSLRRQLAGLLAAQGRYAEAAERFEQLAAEMPERAEQFQRTASRLRAHLN